MKYRPSLVGDGRAHHARAWLVAVTVTPGSTASPWSRTRPLNVLVACAVRERHGHQQAQCEQPHCAPHDLYLGADVRISPPRSKTVTE